MILGGSKILDVTSFIMKYSPQVEVDFEVMFPGKGSLLYPSWSETADIILQELTAGKCEVPSSFENGKFVKGTDFSPPDVVGHYTELVLIKLRQSYLWVKDAIGHHRTVIRRRAWTVLSERVVFGYVRLT